MTDSAHSILVMDDERVILDLAESLLLRLGFNVTTCVNGEEAIMHYKAAVASGTPFLVVIMDLTIYGGMGGLDAAKEILCIDPQAKLVVCSGNVDDAVVTNPQLYGFQVSLPKPYTINQLKQILNCCHHYQ
jgi:CheY-like chemotaxis protein